MKENGTMASATTSATARTMSDVQGRAIRSALRDAVRETVADVLGANPEHIGIVEVEVGNLDGFRMGLSGFKAAPAVATEAAAEPTSPASPASPASPVMLDPLLWELTPAGMKSACGRFRVRQSVAYPEQFYANDCAAPFEHEADAIQGRPRSYTARRSPYVNSLAEAADWCEARRAGDALFAPQSRPEANVNTPFANAESMRPEGAAAADRLAWVGDAELNDFQLSACGRFLIAYFPSTRLFYPSDLYLKAPIRPQEPRRSGRGGSLADAIEWCEARRAFAVATHGNGIRELIANAPPF